MNSQKRHPFVEYFADIWAGIATTYVGMRLTLGYFFSKPVTMRYPEVRPEVPKGYRGLHGYNEEKCLVCRACEAACPVDAIVIEAAGKGKDALVTRFDVDYSKCLFCELCTIPCPSACIWMTEEYDLSRTAREDCTIHFARPKTAEEVAAHHAMLAQKEAEKKAKLEAAKKEKAAALATEETKPVVEA